MNPRRLKVIWRMIKRRNRSKRVAAGLTTRGTARRNRQYPELRGLSPRLWSKRWQQIRRRQFVAQGLTCLGQPRKDRTPQTPTMRAYLEFRATIPMAEIVFSQERWE